MCISVAGIFFGGRKIQPTRPRRRLLLKCLWLYTSGQRFRLTLICGMANNFCPVEYSTNGSMHATHSHGSYTQLIRMAHTQLIRTTQLHMHCHFWTFCVQGSTYKDRRMLWSHIGRQMALCGGASLYAWTNFPHAMPWPLILLVLITLCTTVS